LFGSFNLMWWSFLFFFFFCTHLRIQ
jgi:hypothetical protein